MYIRNVIQNIQFFFFHFVLSFGKEYEKVNLYVNILPEYKLFPKIYRTLMPFFGYINLFCIVPYKTDVTLAHS